MQAAVSAEQIIDTLMEAARQGTEAALRFGGGVMRPQVHVFREELEQPYLMYVSSRPFYRGRDVVTAFRGLGELASLTGASRLLVLWEHQDLCTALEQPGAAGEPTGLVALDVRRDGGHVLAWNRFGLLDGPPTPDGCPTFVPQWREPVRHRDVVLPYPVAVLVETWRAPRVWDPVERAEVLALLEDAGYTLRWVARDEPSPARP